MKNSESIFEMLEKITEDASEEKEIKSAGENTRADSSEDNRFDPLFMEAVDVILEQGQASTSMLQRKLRLGYARTAKIMDELETAGIIGPQEDSAPRQVLITKQQWLARSGDNGKDC